MQRTMSTTPAMQHFRNLGFEKLYANYEDNVVCDENNVYKAKANAPFKSVVDVIVVASVVGLEVVAIQ